MIGEVQPSRDTLMKTAAISLLPITLLLFCSSRCEGEPQGANSGSSSPRASTRTQPKDAANPQAIREMLQRYLSAEDPLRSEEAFRLRRLRDRVLPYLLEAAVAENGKNWRVYASLGYILSGLSTEARQEATPRLLEVLQDENASIYLADGVLTMIGCLGKPGLAIESELIEFRKSRPDLDNSTDRALIHLRSTQCGSIFAKRLAQRPSESTLRQAGAAGTAARDAGPEVVKLLNHPDWDIRLEATKTLGRIGYTEAAPALARLLNDPTDVHLNRMAAESLGRLGATSAVDALKETAAHHWHPEVREEAKIALGHIVSSKPYASKSRANDPFLELLGNDYWGIKSPKVKSVELVQEPLESKLYKSAAPAKMRELSYRRESIWTGPSDRKTQKTAREYGATITVNDDGLATYRKPVEQVPDVALRVENGWLVGSDRGEWGGELVFVGDDGQRTNVRQGNVDDLFDLGGKYIAITGLSHLTINYGRVYQVESSESGQWSCKLWRTLPGAPRSCGKLPSGEIFISTSGGGDIILSQDGTFRMAPSELNK